MKINKLLIFGLAVLATASLSSCLKDQKDLFDESASTRMQNYLSKAQSTLENSEYGWAFDYYPDRTHSLGGFAYTVKFSDGTASVGTEIAADLSTQISSLYKMGTDNGPILSFDTYNVFMHYFATPSSSNYEAYDGDFEFVIDDIQDDVVRVHGKRSLNKMSFHKLKKNYLEYLNGVSEMRDYLIFPGLEGTIDGHSLNATIDVSGGSSDITIDGDTTNVKTSYFVVTDEGIRFDSPITIGETTFDEVKVPMNDDETPSITTADGKTYSINAVYPEGYRRLKDYVGNYWFSYNVRTTNEAGEKVFIADSSKVSLAINDDQSGLILSGLNEHYTVNLLYNRENGTLAWMSQDLCSLGDGVDLWICCLDSDSGYLTWNEEAGMVTTWNGDETNPVYNFGTNGYASGKVQNIDSFILWRLNGTSSVGSVADKTYWVNGTKYITRNVYKVRALSKISE